MQLDTLASFSMRGSMNMQMSPASTHSEIHWLTITRWSDWLQGCVWRQKHQWFHTMCLRLSLVHCSF